MSLQKEITLKSYAKVNLCLDVVERLENGYHNIDTIMQIIDICDEVTVRLKSIEENNNSKFITINASGKQIPLNEDNIVYKASKLIEEKYMEIESMSLDNIYGGIEIYIDKRIPVEAGLAGGSGNGAITLLALNHLLDMRLKYEELLELGKKLGADVPFSISAQIKANNEKLPELKGKGFYAARARGIGDVLEEVEPYKGVVLISKPKEGISTKSVYQGLDLNNLGERPNVNELIKGLESQNFSIIKENMINVLEFYVKTRYDKVVYTKDKIKTKVETGKVLMSGSGPTIFAISQNEKEIKSAYVELKEVNKETILTNTLA